MYIRIVHPCSDAAAAFVLLMDPSVVGKGISNLFSTGGRQK